MRPAIFSAAIMCPRGQHFCFLNCVRLLLPNCTIPKIRSRQFLCYGIDTSEKRKRCENSIFPKNLYTQTKGTHKERHLQRTIDCIVMLNWPATDSNYRHHQRCQTYCRAVRIGIWLLWQMCPAVLVCTPPADDPIPTSAPNRLVRQSNTTASMDGRTFA